MVIYETEYENFNKPEDLLRYMIEEGIHSVHITAKLCGDILGKKDFEMNINDVKEWIRMNREEDILCCVF